MTLNLQNGRRLIAAVALGISATGALISCTATRENPSGASKDAGPAAVATSQPIGAHWVQDQRLRLVMAELSRQNPNWPAGVPQEPENAAQGKPEAFEEVATLADALMTAADRLPEVAGRIKMNEADRKGFLAEAQVLHDQAGQLRDSARQHRIEQMQIQMSSLNSTCISCHSRYRDFSGQLNSPQASLRP